MSETPEEKLRDDVRIGGMTREEWLEPWTPGKPIAEINKVATELIDAAFSLHEMEARLAKAEAEVAACDGHAYLRDRLREAEAECERLRAELSEAIVNGPRQFNEGHRTGRDQAEETAREEIERVRAAFPHGNDESEHVCEDWCIRCKVEKALEGE